MRVGFVGCGRHATRALYPVLVPAGLRLVATCATRMDRAEEIAGAFGATEAYDDVGTLLATAPIDAVLVAVPPPVYPEVVRACVDAGLPVFCEKPAGTSSDAVADLERHAAQAGVPVMVGYMKRFAPAYAEALRRASEPAFGRLTSIHVRFVVGAGFGSLRDYVIDNAVHALDLLRAFGGEVANVRVETLSLDAHRHALSVLVRFESGAVGTAQLGTTASFFQENETLDIVGEEQTMAVTNVDTLIVRPARGAVEMLRPTYTVPLPQNFTGTTMGFVPELEHFAKVVTDGVACASDLRSARKTLELAEQVARGIE